MDRSNLLIGAGVLVGLGTLAYWFMNREEGAGTKTKKPSQFVVTNYTAVVRPVLTTSPSPAMMTERNF